MEQQTIDKLKSGLMGDVREYINLLEKQAANELIWHKREDAESMKLKNTGRYLCRCMDWMLFRYVHNEETGQDEQVWEPHFADEGSAGMVVTHFADFPRPMIR